MRHHKFLADGKYGLNVVADVDALMPQSLALAAQIKENAPLTMQTRKEALLRLGTDEAGADDRDLIATCSISADFRQGMQAFFKKRWPEGEGR